MRRGGGKKAKKVLNAFWLFPLIDKTNNSKRFKKLDYLLMEKNRRDRSIESTSWWCQLLDGDRMYAGAVDRNKKSLHLTIFFLQ